MLRGRSPETAGRRSGHPRDSMVTGGLGSGQRPVAAWTIARLLVSSRLGSRPGGQRALCSAGRRHACGRGSVLDCRATRGALPRRVLRLIAPSAWSQDRTTIDRSLVHGQWRAPGSRFSGSALLLSCTGTTTRGELRRVGGGRKRRWGRKSRRRRRRR